MDSTRTLKPQREAMPALAALGSSRAAAVAATILVFGVALTTPRPAAAVDGCLVLLCFAAPNWRAIPQCVPPIRQVLRDLARGKPFPTCAMAGGGNSASHAWASAPTFCPPQYTRVIEGESTTSYWCDYAGAVSISIDGGLFARTWWNMAGDTVTEFTPAAKARFGTWDTRFDDDYARWLAAQPPASAPGADLGGA
jgi:hypothetical protein